MEQHLTNPFNRLTPTAATLVAVFTLTSYHADAAITALTVTNGSNADYSIQTSLADGDLSYGDRTAVYALIADNAPYLVGSDYIRTANDDRSDLNVNINFTIDTLSTVYVSLDDREKSNPPNFMATYGFVDTGDNILNFDVVPTVSFSIYSAVLPAGNYDFTAQKSGAANSMYTIMAQAVPEPSSGILIGLGAGLALFRRCRNQRSSSLHFIR